MIHLTASKVAGFQAGGDLLCPCPEGAALLHASTVLHACKTVYDPPGIWNVRNAELFKTIWHQWLSTMFATHKHMQFWGATGGAAVCCSFFQETERLIAATSCIHNGTAS